MSSALSSGAKPSPLSAGFTNASILFYSLWLLLPAVQTTGGAAAGVFCVALFGAGVLLDTSYLKRHWLDFALRALCAAGLPLIFRFLLHRGTGNFWGYYCQQGMFWFPLLYCAYAWNRRDPRLWRWFGIVVLGCVAMTTLTTICWLVQGMLRGGRVYAYSRSLGSGEPGQEAYLKELMLRNIGGYDFIYATVLALPITCYALFRSRGWRQAGFAALLLSQFVMIALSQYTYAFLFAAALMALELGAAMLRLVSKRRFRRPLSTAASLLFCLLPLGVLYLFRVPLVAWAASFCESIGFANVAYSLQQLLNALTSQAVDSAARLDYYRLPLQGILQSPWLGALAGGEPLLSQHSDILDLLSGAGIVGAVAVCGMIACIGRGLFHSLGSKAAQPHLALQWVLLFACALLGTVVYSRDITLIACASILLLRD